jgi:predicted nucleic acid-binding protein
MTTTPVVIDTNVLVALVDANDKWHPVAVALRDGLLALMRRIGWLTPIADPVTAPELLTRQPVVKDQADLHA